MDIRGNMFGLLIAHPLTPLVSLHHLDVTDPIFPNMTTIKALEHLVEASKFDPHRILQQTVCYDRWFSWTISVSWGYAVQVFEHNVFLPEAVRAEETFRPWKKGNAIDTLLNLNTRRQHPDPCRRPAVFFLDKVSSGIDGIKSVYKRMIPENCTLAMVSPRRVEEIRVFSQQLNLDTKQLQAPRRHCCDVLPSSTAEVMEVGIREC
ncbi:unnamed protein product, partial [Ilex paraguariensis]